MRSTWKNGSSGGILPIQSPEIKHCHCARLCYFATPFSLVETLAERGKGLEFRVRVDVGGHNNTELNPVFRGMPSPFWCFEGMRLKEAQQLEQTAPAFEALERAGLKTKGKLC